MRELGISVRSLEEAKWNGVFAGRNWNAGEVIEIVLRRPNGSFAPLRWLVRQIQALSFVDYAPSFRFDQNFDNRCSQIYVMAHELAHCKHMNHGPSFQKTDVAFLKAVLASIAAGFTGVGYWGKGNTIAGDVYEPLIDGDLPEFTWSVLSTSLPLRVPS